MIASEAQSAVLSPARAVHVQLGLPPPGLTPEAAIKELLGRAPVYATDDGHADLGVYVRSRVACPLGKVPPVTFDFMLDGNALGHGLGFAERHLPVGENAALLFEAEPFALIGIWGGAGQHGVYLDVVLDLFDMQKLGWTCAPLGEVSVCVVRQKKKVVYVPVLTLDV